MSIVDKLVRIIAENILAGERSLTTYRSTKLEHFFYKTILKKYKDWECNIDGHMCYRYSYPTPGLEKEGTKTHILYIHDEMADEEADKIFIKAHELLGL